MEGLPPYATEKNYIEAKQIVAKLFIDMEIHCFTDDFLQEKTIELLSIVYGKGGDYTKEMYWEFGKAFFEKESLLNELREKGEYNSKEEAVEALIALVQRFYGNTDKAQLLVKYVKEDGAKEVLFQLDMDGYIKDVYVKGICQWLI